ncbi:helix-hairpin-helix domain-containing protein [Zoogloea sp.]|uniref:ComEA family DNA-binding protein n=1 Tax=Zoogloea sp. TaxID=49181 RepID=UPI0026140580|nr:helix-hairpin-helix domain-containing protein [Zoogloea sp.]MDD3352384.1 helix-hairpin-helix domain-containing protein [Zoogloea sp.]
MMHPTPTSPAPTDAAPLRIGPNHGYAFNGDQVRLDAELLMQQSDALDGQAWALQLWTCDPSGDGSIPLRHKIAEAPISLATADARPWAVAFAQAFPPAGSEAHPLALALATGHEGHFEQIVDTVSFPRTEAFCQPRLTGSAGFSLDGQAVRVHVEGVENPRTADNLSGSLSLELWALASDGTAAEWPLCAIELGTLGGQCSLSALSFECPVTPAPPGTWQVALRLREWTAAGYVTRDQRDLPQPVCWNAPAPEVLPAPAGSGQKDKAEKGRSTAPRTAVNTATAAELATVKGLPKKVAAAILTHRPFLHLDDLLALKGMGARLLDKLRTQLTL